MSFLFRPVRLLLASSLVLAGTAVVSPTTFAAGSGTERQVIKVGAVIDQTGGSTTLLYKAAVELAVRQMNQALEKAGSEVRFDLVLGDSKSNPPFAQSEALRLINQDGVKALVTDSSGVTVAVNKLNYDPATQAKQKVPITCFQCSSSFINDPAFTDADAVNQAAQRDADNWLFRVFYVAKYEAAALVQIALKRTADGKGNGDGTFKIAIYADNGHRALATSIPPLVASFYKGKATTEIVYLTNPADLSAGWAKVVDDKSESGATEGAPDVVIVAMLPEQAAKAIEAYRKAGHTIPILSNNSFRRDYILKDLGAVANGLEGSSVTQVDKSASGKAFLKAFQAAAGQAPEMTASGAYDATATLLLAALSAAGDPKHPKDVTPAAIRDGLAKINASGGKTIRPTVEDYTAAVKALGRGKPINYEGAYHSIDWDAAGDMYPPLVHWVVENGKFVERELYRCDPQHPLCPVK
ncbi:MAG: ABC transporter substrate-binding protein [Rhodoplanes sp.]|uniref:ABC transporter substrate-binding protein n=1 Tax=Rhodoplanes sp. TaxID=1968906 RepID=UPI001825739E|nr:ABC transporter substrate-binding protein [Rhodoplanes sp.]NVO16675.1 ABC transporter substrate-binding protein [Rhodoplanes sp.]